MEKDYIVKIRIFDNIKYTIDLYSKAEFKNEPKYLEDSEENKDISYEYFDTKEEAEKYIQECKNKVIFNIKENYFDNGDYAVHFSTVQLPIKPKDIFIHGSSSDFYSCFFDTKDDFMRYIEEELVDSEPCLVINDTDFDIDLNG